MLLLLLLLGKYLPGRLRIVANRAGAVSEITDFLRDLEVAYFALLRLEARLRELERRGRYHATPVPTYIESAQDVLEVGPEALLTLPPEYWLTVEKVHLESPGFWGFAGSLNPLQQIREYLNDRHKRRQDLAYREGAETTKLKLENELLQFAVWENENAVLHDRIQLLRDIGYTDPEIRQFVWQHAGRQLAALGRHQDTGLIQSAE